MREIDSLTKIGFSCAFKNSFIVHNFVDLSNGRYYITCRDITVLITRAIKHPNKQTLGNVSQPPYPSLVTTLQF